jgi:nucleoside-diphosphate-sugar epimerase
MKILLTGGSGFLGNFIKVNLQNKGEHVISIGRAGSNNIVADLTNQVPSFNDSYDYIIHCAGKAHINPKSEFQKLDFYHVNLKGTQNLCEALNSQFNNLKGFIFISSVAVYGKESGLMLTEDSELLAMDPYGSSKIKTEQFLQAWCKQWNIPLLILRLPLVIGENAPGNFGLMEKAIRNGYYLRIGNGETKRSMVLAIDVAEFISRNLGKSGVYNLTDSYDPSFKELEEVLKSKYSKSFTLSIPYFLAKFLAILGDNLGGRFPINSNKLLKVCSSLTFSSKKAADALNWTPTNVLNYYKENRN